ncbi:MAG: DUF3298 and DUF4163 domain-containing protein [Candidatus Uhrbacteria bacterium]|nr:DUF3298 and DUF4163 domain-containing protein [Candidatus Uhrbacteria bacterium]
MKRLLLPAALLAALGAGCVNAPIDLPGTDDSAPKDATPSVRGEERPHAGLGMKSMFRSWNDGGSDRCVFEIVYPQFQPRYSAGDKDVDRRWDAANRELERAALTGYVPTSTSGAFDMERGADSYIESCRGELEELSTALGNDETSYMQYVQSMGYDVELLQDGLASIVVHSYSYSGGVHGLPWIHGVTLTVPEGRRLALGDLIKPEQLKPLMQMARRQLVDDWNDALFPEASAALSVFIADTTPATEEELAAFSIYEDFYLTPTGIVFYWNVYDVAPYAAGQQTVTIPFRTVSDWMLPDSPITALFRS